MMNSVASLFRKESDLEQQVEWDSVYRDFLPRIYNFFRYRTGDDLVAEDLTALTFEKAWRARKDFLRQAVGGMPAWLFAIARNVAIDHFRMNRLEVGLETVVEVSDSFSVEENFQDRDEIRRLEILLGILNPRDRELLAMKYGGELTNREIARIVGLSETNVGTILSRIVSKLRTEWETGHER